jgi:hypothetical protein
VTAQSTTRWTERDFDDLSWHDNSVHALRILEGDHGTGRLILDIDYILEWIRDGQGGFAFSIAPASLTFVSVFALKMTIDYAAATAAVTPFQIDGIERRVERRQHGDTLVWRIPINWPGGEISFEAVGFVLELTGPAIISNQQQLSR